MIVQSALYTLADTTTFDLGTIDAVQSITNNLFLVVVNGYPVLVQDPDGTQRKALCWAWLCWRTNHTREGSSC